jgi:hypothetical protein
MGFYARSCVTLIAAWLLSSSAARAQTPPSPLPLTSASKADDALLGLLTDNPLTASGNLVDYYERLLSVVIRQGSSFPIGASSGGFTYSFDPQLGLPVRRTQSFGPMFADRPLTIGRHKFSASLSAQQTAWRALGGVDLKQGLTLTYWNLAQNTQSGHPEAAFTRTQMTFRTTREVFNATYGFSDRIDLGLLVTYGQAVVTGNTKYVLTDLTTGATIDEFHKDYAGTVSGLGDAAARMKYEFLRRSSIDLALGLDWKGRPPTAPTRPHILGTNVTQARAALIGSLPHGNIAPHFNVGYTLVRWFHYGQLLRGVQGSPLPESDEVDYTVGADAAVTNALTVSGDVIGRTLLQSYNFKQSIGPSVSEMAITGGKVNVLLGAAAAKLLVRRDWLLNLSVAFPLNNGGLKPSVTPVIGLERAF